MVKKLLALLLLALPAISPASYISTNSGSDTLSNLNCTSNQIPKWNGSRWACATDATSAGTLTSAHLFVGDGSNAPQDVAVSGDLTLANTGAFSIGASKVTNAMLAGSIAYSKLSLTGAILNADLAGSIAATKLVGTDIATVGTVTGGVWNGTAIGAAYGGTGATTLTANNVILGNGTSAVQFVAPGSSGNVLTSNGTTWTSAAASGGSGVTTMAAVGSSPNANGASISSTTLTLQPADATNPGVLSNTTQSILGAKTWLTNATFMGGSATNYVLAGNPAGGTTVGLSFHHSSVATDTKVFLYGADKCIYYEAAVDAILLCPQGTDRFQVFDDSGNVMSMIQKTGRIRGKVGTAAVGDLATQPAGLSFKTDVTAVGNVGGGEDDMITFSVPGASLAATGDYISWEAAGTFAANGNNKEVKCYFGATALGDTGTIAQNGGSWEMHGKILRSGATAQLAQTNISSSSASTLGAFTTYSTPAETLANAITLKCTAQGTADNDIIQKFLIVRWNSVNLG